MSEMKGAIISMIIFISLIIPFLLQTTIGSVHQHAFMKMTTEVTSLVHEEGGVTDKVHDVMADLQSRGYDISFTDDDGEGIDGKQDYGDVIHIDFDYEYENVRGEENLTTHNSVAIARR